MYYRPWVVSLFYGIRELASATPRALETNFPVLTWSTKLAALRGNLWDSTLLHLGVFTDWTAPVLGIVEARSSPGGEGVSVVWYSRAALTVPILYKYLNIKNHPTTLDLGFWHHWCMGGPHCFPPLMHFPHVSPIVGSKRHWAFATGSLPVISVYLMKGSVSASAQGHGQSAPHWAAQVDTTSSWARARATRLDRTRHCINNFILREERGSRDKH